MNERKRVSQKVMLQKYDRLNIARDQLKNEFVGIDKAIDEVIEAISSWYIFPNLQEKPVVVNLWGLTGVGKSALVNRLTQLIDFDDRFYQFDLGGEHKETSEIKRQFKDIHEYQQGAPVIMAFDELQYARTIDNTGSEMDESFSFFWQLIDSGKIFVFTSDAYLFLYQYIFQLKGLLEKGVEVEEGKVVAGREYFCTHMIEDEVPESKVLYFVPETWYSVIHNCAKEKFENHFDLKLELLKLNGEETINLLKDVLSYVSRPKIMDCSKSLIFVLGNLDEAYTMNCDFNPDMSADEFHEQSLKISVVHIKNALQQRFRNEQIARLGNIHIIYPAFNKAGFYKIIELELKRISEQFHEHQKLYIEFDKSIPDLIYQEGVYPTQGTRPVYSTIHQLVKAKLGRIAAEELLKELIATHIGIKASDGSLIVEFANNECIVHTMSLELQLPLKNLRKNKRDDVQAITAVHEAGHAIVSAVLLKTSPEVIFSNTAEIETNGFVYTKFKWNYISRKEIIKRLAFYLGGYCAEKLIFGNENVTTGARSDIEAASAFLMEMLKECGMGSLVGAYHAKTLKTRYYFHDEKNSINSEAEKWFKEAISLAENVLIEQEPLLLKIAEYLSDERTMTKKQFREYMERYAVNFNPDELIEDGERLFYRKHLKEKISRMGEVSAGTYDLMLNRSENNR